MNPTHEHDWAIVKSGFEATRRCVICGDIEYGSSVDEFPSGARSKRLSAGISNRSRSYDRSQIEGAWAKLVGGHGGFVSYDSSRMEAKTGDGLTVTVSEILSANLGIRSGELREKLEHLPRTNYASDGFASGGFVPNPSYHPGKALTDPMLSSKEIQESIQRFTDSAATAAVNAKAMAEEMSKITDRLSQRRQDAVSGNTKPWTSEDALTLILREITNSEDPMQSAGEWITKFTNGVSDIIRKLPGGDDD